MYPIKPLKLFFVLVISIFFLFTKLSFGESFKQESQDTVKKIVMMLNISAKEFEEGVVDGKIVDSPEYKESQIFLQQATERFSKVSEIIKNKEELNRLNHQFPELLEMIKNKVHSEKVWDKINILNSELVKTFGIEINRIPVTPVSLENGQTIYENNCSSCHGLKGNGDGPMAKNLKLASIKIYHQNKT